MSLGTGFGASPHSLFERFNKLRTAIRIARIVQYIGSKINACRSDDLRMGSGQRQENEVSSRHIGNGYALMSLCAGAILWNREFTGQCRPADLPQIELEHRVLSGTHCSTNLASPFHFDHMALAIVDGQKMQLAPIFFGQRSCDGRIQASAGKDD